MELSRMSFVFHGHEQGVVELVKEVEEAGIANLKYDTSDFNKDQFI